MPDYSKAPRGLFVLVCVGRVFTAIAISPSNSLRQLSARYAIRAGLNLPDKELRYRRTVHNVTSYVWLRRLHVSMQIGLYHPTLTFY